CTLLYYAMDYW
nr:immunoglobulin heavy chain junction region [Mus musculus]NSM04272.1 immunoglobulin heavy chain junction region [Mus musculus]NSM05155.1 immunoglobulin heavy chain junction region [Mus musculus]NSM05946.1 immunoglobulin heavy chain junction region [Mus musculus]NSM06175.1 immunoglobulin heavy chain junction region [Mus musculus]